MTLCSIFSQIEDLIDRWNKKGKPVVGVIIEPVQAEGGDKFASADFFQKLRDLTNKVLLLSNINEESNH